MKKEKKVLCIGLLIISFFLFGGCGAKTGTKAENAKKGLPSYLVTALPDNPYACAEISIKNITDELGGTVNISWKTFDTAQELQEYIAAKAKKETEEHAEWMYYQCKLQDDFHALDLYSALECYDRADNPLCAVTSEKGAFYRFSQEAQREIIVKDNYIYALTYMEPVFNSTPPDYVQRLLNAFVNNSQEKEGDYLTGYALDKEKLYWLDHESRETTLENPKRTFTEIKAKDIHHGNNKIIIQNFGMLLDAEYEIKFPESDAGLQISFHFKKNIPATGYENYLQDGLYAIELYLMRVTDLQTGNLLQIEDVKLCIDRTDTITFKDLNSDGFPDMIIDKPIRIINSKSSAADDASSSYVLWNPEKNKFEFRTQVRQEESYYAPIRELPENAERQDYCVLIDSQGELYIPKDSETKKHVENGQSVYIAHPGIVDHQYFSSNIGFASNIESVIEIYTNPVVNNMGENALSQDWEHFVQEVTRCSELCEGRVYHLDFEKYRLEGGSDLYGYTFDFDAYDRIYEVAVFIRLEKVNMIEMIGIRQKTDNDVLKDVTRYLGASFIDYGGKVWDGYCKMEDNVGADEWAYPELHNMFSWAMDRYCIYAKRPDPSFPNERAVSFEEPQIERVVRNALEELWQLDDEERNAFEERALMMSDLAVITKLKCTRSLDVPSVLRIEINHYVQEIAVAEGERISYKDLANLSGLKVLEMDVFDLSDYSFVVEMTSLRELIIWAWYEVENMDFLGNLGDLRSLQLMSRDPDSKISNPVAFSNITELSALGNCKNLAYLYLRMPSLADFSFLENMPEVYTMVLDGEDGVIPDLELLPNAEYIEFYGKFY